MASPRLEILSMPKELLLDPGDFIPEPKQWPKRNFFMQMFGEMGAYIVIGRAMATRLVGFAWPKFLAAEDPDWRWLYVARAPTAEIVKIGLSTNPIARMQTLRSSIPKMPQHDFELLGALPFCSREHEATLCDLFGGSRFSGNEWFRETPATRVLSWHVVAMRSDKISSRARYDQARLIEGLAFGLRCLIRGTEAIPQYGGRDYGLRRRACSGCGSHRHHRRCCPTSPRLSGWAERRCRICRSEGHGGNRCPQRARKAA